MYQRIIEKTIKSNLFKGKVVIVYGPRQVGKTTLVKKIIAESGRRTAYFQCDIPSEREIFAVPEPDKIKKALGNVELVVVDEAQLIENIGVVLKTFVDRFPAVQVIATGSSSFDLANKVREPLTGRAYEYILYPLSYEEVATCDGHVAMQKRAASLLRFGWYPGIINASEKDARTGLELIQQNTLYKDIFMLENIRKPKVLTDLVRVLAHGIGSTQNAHNIAREIKTTDKTVERYLDVLEKLFVIVRLYGYSRNTNNEVKKGFKAYFLDVGMRNSIIQAHNDLPLRDDIGGLFENYFVMERIKYRAYHGVHANHYFWRDYQGREVDYIEERDGRLAGYECKYAKGTSAALHMFRERYDAAVSVVTKDNYIDLVMPPAVVE